MKPQSILVIGAAALARLPLLAEQVTPVSIEDFAPAVQDGIFIGQREYLETDPGFRQVIPYVLFAQYDETIGTHKYLAYRRTPKAGDARLHNRVSIGFGGHIDLADVVHQDSVIDLIATIGQAVGREIQEELIFKDMGGQDLGLVSVGTIIEDTSEVGRVHLGIVMMATMPEGASAVCAEEELETLPPMTARELLDDTSFELEGWTRMALEFLLKVEEA